MYKKIMIVLPFVLLAVFGFLLYFDALKAVDILVYDNLLQSEGTPSDNIIIVGIDDHSIDNLGAWPFPRRCMAQAIETLSEAGAAVIGVDVLCDSPSSSAEDDEMLIAAAKATDRVVFGSMGAFGEGDQDVLRVYRYDLPFAELNAVTETAFLNVIPDVSDGVIRKAMKSFKYGDEDMESFPTKIYGVYRESMGMDANFDIPCNQFGQYNIDYIGKSGAYKEVSFYGVINGEYPKEMFRDAVILIGPYSPGIGQDLYYTPLDKQERTFGVEIHANTVQNLLEGDFKRDVGWYFNLIPLVLFCVAAAAFFRRMSSVQSFLLFIAMVVVQLAAAKILYDGFGLIVSSAYTLLFLCLAYICQLILSVLNAQQEKAHIRGLFGRFVAEEVVNEIISGSVSVELGGVLREVTVLFVDIRGFTAFSETNPPENVVSMVNRYLNLTSKSIQRHGGTIDKYIGDATMAVFNAPTDLENHALCGVKAAWAMKQGAAELQAEILEKFGVELQFGIGVNTGQAVVGNMGSDFRMDYTVIGDTVNTAARLESSAAKGQIIISDSVYQLVRDHVEINDLGELKVKNKQEGVRAYEVVGVRE